MISFKDLNGLKVELSFDGVNFDIDPEHVLIVLKHNGKWLLTRHRERGVEFPGGKLENDETVEAAAIRETFEETGVRIKHLEKIAEYVVHDSIPFCKVVFTAKVLYMVENPELHETEGVLWMSDGELDCCETLSFHMIDAGMSAIRERVNAGAQ